MHSLLPPTLVASSNKSQRQVYEQLERRGDTLASKNLLCQGPPGSGKAKVISVAVLGHVARGEPALVIAETNDAVDNVIRHTDAWGVGLSEYKYRVRESTIEAIGVFDEIRDTTQADDNMVDVLSSMDMLQKIEITPEASEHLQSYMSKEQRQNNGLEGKRNGN